MRPRFEQDLRHYGELAKGEHDIDVAMSEDKNIAQDFRDFSGALNWRLKKTAEGQQTPKEAQKAIYSFQKEKQEIMRDFKAELACLDDPECKQREREPNERYATYNEESQRFNYMDDEGYKREATFGEIITDLEWDVDYFLDKDRVPRGLYKTYLLERAKRDLSEKLDQQIIASESESSGVHEWKREAYKRVAQKKETGEIKKRSGYVCEKIVTNFLKQLSIDDELPFLIRRADIYQDVEQKIDFIIHREEHVRGVGVEAGKQDVGIQFSINERTREKKQTQVARAKRRLGQRESIKDIILVIFPEIIAGDLMKKWKDEGRQAGGPEKGLDQKLAQELYSRLLGGVFSEKEISRQWDKVSGKFIEN
ncbi:hypothetical protein ACFL1U_03215 [Patescibacteria group bacterium]